MLFTMEVNIRMIIAVRFNTLNFWKCILRSPSEFVVLNSFCHVVLLDLALPNLEYHFIFILLLFWTIWLGFVVGGFEAISAVV